MFTTFLQVKLLAYFPVYVKYFTRVEMRYAYAGVEVVQKKPGVIHVIALSGAGSPGAEGHNYNTYRNRPQQYTDHCVLLIIKAASITN
jgi:hypothetical protein